MTRELDKEFHKELDELQDFVEEKLRRNIDLSRNLHEKKEKSEMEHCLLHRLSGRFTALVEVQDYILRMKCR